MSFFHCLAVVFLSFLRAVGSCVVLLLLWTYKENTGSSDKMMKPENFLRKIFSYVM